MKFQFKILIFHIFRVNLWVELFIYKHLIILFYQIKMFLVIYLAQVDVIYFNFKFNLFFKVFFMARKIIQLQLMIINLKT